MKTKPKKLRKIAVIAGSKTDIPAIREGINLLRIAKRQKKIVWEIFDVCSAHRNPKELKKFLREYKKKKIDVLIAAAGKLAALLGDADAIGRNELKNSVTHIVAVPLKGKIEEASMAAYLSAKQVPNSQFIFQE